MQRLRISRSVDSVSVWSPHARNISSLEEVNVNEVIRMSGYFAAHAVWCVSDGDALTPMLVTLSADGASRLQRIDAETNQQAVAHGLRLLEDVQGESRGAVLIYEGVMDFGCGTHDVLFVDMRSKEIGMSNHPHVVGIPYRNAGCGAGFAVFRLKVIEGESNSDVSIELASEFFEGVNSHEQGAAVWKRYLDESC